MGFLEIVFSAIGLAMDAFAVSVCKGLSMFKMNWRKAFTIAIYFGFFQMIMPLLGFLLGMSFSEWIKAIDHWIAFFLLVFIGGKMIKESSDKTENVDDKVDFKTMSILAIATSIDALAIGITYAFLEVKNCMFSFLLIGIITFFISLLGVKIGNKFGNQYGNKAEMIGGLILIFIGIKILIEHTFFK